MTESKAAEYTLRIVGKRQVTFPEDILDRLGFEKGDEFRLVMRSPHDIRLIPCVRIRRDLLTPEIEEILKKRRAEIDAGAVMISQEDLLKKAAARSARKHVAKAGAKASLRRVKAAVRERERESAR